MKIGFDLIRTLRALLAVGLVLPVLAQAGTITYYHNDLLGSPVAATDASGHVIWRESYRPFGERVTNDPASAGNDVWYTSRRQDADTGLVYMGARYYDPVVGRFVSKDPAGFDDKNVQSFNRYTYANDNPYRYIDPNGRQAIPLPAITPPVAAKTNLPSSVLGRPSQEQMIRSLDGYSSPSMGRLSIPSLTAGDIFNFALGGAPQAVGAIGGLIFSDSAAPESGAITHDIKARPTPGADGATSAHDIERLDGDVISVTHQVVKDGETIHQHQTHIGKYGSERRFPDEWIQNPTVPKE